MYVSATEAMALSSTSINVASMTETAISQGSTLWYCASRLFDTAMCHCRFGGLDGICYLTYDALRRFAALFAWRDSAECLTVFLGSFFIASTRARPRGVARSACVFGEVWPCS